MELSSEVRQIPEQEEIKLNENKEPEEDEEFKESVADNLPS